MSGPEDKLDTIHSHMDAINRKLRTMPTTRECWVFVLGFACAVAMVAMVTLPVLFQ